MCWIAAPGCFGARRQARELALNLAFGIFAIDFGFAVAQHPVGDRVEQVFLVGALELGDVRGRNGALAVAPLEQELERELVQRHALAR